MLFSEGVATCKDCLAAEFTISDWGLIKGPGKFEGEPLATYHAWHYMMDGFEDETVYSDDRPIYRVGNVLIEESEQGFVYGTIFDSDEEASAKLAEIEEEVSEEEGEEDDVS